jgi:hypothetical protein
MRIVVAVIVACLTTGSWHWQRVEFGPARADAAVRSIYTGGMTMDVRAAPFITVGSAVTL